MPWAPPTATHRRSCSATPGAAPVLRAVAGVVGRGPHEAKPHRSATAVSNSTHAIAPERQITKSAAAFQNALATSLVGSTM
jgi:hypothetical protein